jgi:hypothetical protein
MWERRPYATAFPAAEDEPRNILKPKPDAEKQKPRASGAFGVGWD